MRYERVKIVRDPHTVYNRPVLPWEIAILEFTFGEGNVERLEAVVDTDTKYPDPKEEFHRLQQTYGSDPESGIPYVASVYGQAGSGVRAIAQAIKQAEADAKKAKPRRSARKLAKEYANDPLVG